MNSTDAAVVKTLLDKPQNIVIIPHKNPDGDAMGSCLGLQHYLKLLGQESTIVAPNDYPKFLKWLPGSESVLNFELDNTKAKKALENASLIFTLDFNDLSRTGQLESNLKESNADFIMIDHHQQPSDYAKVTYSDVGMSSTCEMIYKFIEALGRIGMIDAQIATCLYTGIMTDTGSFKFAATTSQTHRVAAELMERGADHVAIHQKVFDTNSPSRLQLLGVALKNMVILENHHTAYITLTQEELDASNFKKGDTEGFVNYGLTIENIIFAVIFIENKEEGIIKISFRSIGDFSVNEFARAHFNGGGHTNAAGGRSELSMAATIKKFESLLNDYKAQLTT
ncbi:bifunctional oligoribonuclease/PAP phosphatase NrnA [Allomuricauda sp. d1]|uniref:DHH family phosphoesterase n=1 Tax=Allomuricauda sp. d1 TaxID=3136725 RepID=UPI0031CE0402